MCENLFYIRKTRYYRSFSLCYQKRGKINLIADLMTNVKDTYLISRVVVW